MIVVLKLIRQTFEENIMLNRTNEPTLILRQYLEELKKASAEKNRNSMNSISSNVIGQANLLTSRLLEITTEHMSLEETLSVLEKRKETIFLLVECFAYIVASKRKILGEHIQLLIANIYDDANEGLHYLARDVVFDQFSRIIDNVVRIALPVFQDTGMDNSARFFTDIFMPWIHGISTPIRKAAKHYFRDECGVINDHPISDITFAAKAGGVQIGTRIIISFADAHPAMTFHVKAHQNYAAMTSFVQSSQRKGIDLKELFVYKVLEYIGICPKVHFITHKSGEDRAFDKNALFIATQDAAYTKSPRRDLADVSGKEKVFHPVEALYTMEKGKKIGDPTFFARFNAELDDVGMGQIKFEATIFDIIARVFRLGDLNENNLALISVSTAEKNYEKWKMFDFTVPENMEGRYIIADEESTTEGFIRGNGVLRHPAVFLQDALMVRERSEKIQIGNTVITLLEQGRPGISHPEKRSMGLTDAIDRAFNDVMHYMTHPINDTTRAAILGINLDKSLADLEDYRHSALQNFGNLRNGLRSRQTDLSETKASFK